MVQAFMQLPMVAQVAIGAGVGFLLTIVVAVAIGVFQSLAGGRINSNVGLVAVGGLLAQLSINVDLQPMFDSMNTYLPTFLGLFGLIGGIVAAMKFAQYIIGIVTRALSGSGSM